MVWRSPEPSWWPIASLVSLMCTHRWTRPTQWTNVAHRVVLRKGSSRLLFFPSTLHSLLHSLISTVSPSSSIFRQAASASSLFSLLVTQFPYFIGIYLSRDVSSFFFFLFFTRMSPLIFLPYCRLLFPMRPLSPPSPSLFPSRMTLLPPFVLLRWFERFLLLNRWVFTSVLLGGKEKKILDCRAFFFFSIN